MIFDSMYVDNTFQMDYKFPTCTFTYHNIVYMHLFCKIINTKIYSLIMSVRTVRIKFQIHIMILVDSVERRLTEKKIITMNY